MAHIVIIEDERAVRIVIRRSLQLDGHTVADADAAEAGRWLVARHRTDLVISDVRLGSGNGIAAMVVLRRTWPTLPLLAISGSDREELGARLAAAGLTRGVWALAKPFGRDELVALVRTILAK